MQRYLAHSAMVLLAWIGTAQAGNILIPSGAKDNVKEEANRTLVLDFWANFFSGHTDQWRRWLSPQFVNHDPFEPSGGQAFADFVHGNEARQPAAGATPAAPPPKRSDDQLFVMADGDLVLIVHPGGNRDDLTEDVHGNIVRVIDGKITDWWLIGQFPGRAEREKKINPHNKAGVQPLPSSGG